MIEERVRNRLGSLSNYLGDAEWIGGDFSAADILWYWCSAASTDRASSRNTPISPPTWRAVSIGRRTGGRLRRKR